MTFNYRNFKESLENLPTHIGMYIIPIYFFTALKQTKEPWVEVIMKKKVVVVPQRNSLWPLGERKRQEGGKLIFKATSIAKPCILPSLLGVSSIYGATSLHTRRLRPLQDSLHRSLHGLLSSLLLPPMYYYYPKYIIP